MNTLREAFWKFGTRRPLWLHSKAGGEAYTRKVFNGKAIKKRM
jgi:hypothetical protein